MNMELYEIRGEYPNNDRFHAHVIVDDQRDAIALAQGLRKVTTVKRVAVYSMDDYRPVYYDELKVPSLAK